MAASLPPSNLCLVSILVVFILHHALAYQPIGFSTRIINHNSPRSPFYNPNITRFEKIQNSIRRSSVRHNNILNVIAKTSSNSIDAPVWSDSVDMIYQIEYYIGTPPIRTYAAIDTGSSMTWLQCLPCIECYYQSYEYIFDPAKSSSYKKVSCDDPQCRKMSGNRDHPCGPNGNCKYQRNYLDNSHSMGDVVKETLKFHNGNDDVTFDNILIGCGHDNLLSGKDGVPGIFGFGPGKSSILDQLSYNLFSYCLGDFDDGNAYGFIKVGEVASLSGYRTPLTISHAFYFLTLEGISVEDTSLSIPADTFTTQEGSDFFIDTGSTYTYLRLAGFNALANEIEKMMQHISIRRIRQRSGGFPLCFRGDDVNIMLFPKVTLHFAGADLELPPENTWVTVQGKKHCLAMFATDETSILGNYQQRNIIFGFDLKNKVMSFESFVCSG